MRKVLLLVPVLLAASGCKTGYLIDRFRDRPEVVSGQIARFGLSTADAQCLSTRLSKRLSYGQLRQLAIRAAAIQTGLSRSGQLTMNELIIAANTTEDREIRLELDSSAKACGIEPVTMTAVAAAPNAAAATPGGSAPAAGPAGADAATPGVQRVLTGPEAEAAFAGRVPPPTGGGAVTSAAGDAYPAPLWLNLGAASSGQAIAIDGATVEREEGARTAWFRTIEPEGKGPSLTWYRLRVDCGGRTIEPLARRRVDAEGKQQDYEAYPAGYEKPAPIETGTVTEIAWLSLCT
jgi:hypothetical protein